MVIPATGGLGATVDVDGLAGDVARQGAGQEDGGPGHLIDVAGPAHRHGETEAVLLTLGVRRDGGEALGPGDVGSQGVDPDAVGSELEGSGFGVVDDPRFGRRVGGVARGCPHPLD